jgi:outer membrane immunogenic protein
MKRFVLAAISLVAFAVASPASAADLAARPYTKAPPLPSAAVYDWAGFYIGGNVGGAWTDFNGSNTVPCSAACPFFVPPNADAINANARFKGSNGSFTGGGQAGYNWQLGAVVTGVEADINWVGAKSDLTSTLPYVTNPANGNRFDNSARADWIATIRGRLGMTAGSNLLLYVTGGAAIAGLKLTSTVTELVPIPVGNCALFHCGTSSVDTTKLGWTAGGGAEFAIDRNWSIKAEYLYSKFGGVGSTTTYALASGASAQPINHNVDTTIQMGRVGFNYRFGGPVVARY